MRVTTDKSPSVTETNEHTKRSDLHRNISDSKTIKIKAVDATNN